jgi:phosphonate transport system permease protein
VTRATTTASSRRPTKPPIGWTVWAGLIGFAAFTVWAANPWTGIGFTLLPLITNFVRGSSIIVEFFAPNWAFAPRTIGPFIETFQIAILATAIGCSLALPLALLASRVTAPNAGAYAGVRSVLNAIRSLPDVLYAMIFVASAGFGPLAGVLALIFFNLGITAKLLSETCDAIDLGPVEAANAAGANRLQSAAQAVIPQILPNYIAYSLYVFELNVRASLVLGFVGAGGIGTLLVTQINRFLYPNASVIIILTFLIVFTLDQLSIALRRRLV